MGEGNFFRQEAVNHLKNQPQGEVFVNHPLPFRTIAVWLSLVMLLIIIFIVFADFSEKYTVKGFLNTNKGIAHIYPPKNGTITKSSVFEGKHVNKGDVLFAINTGYEKISTELKQHEFKQLKKRAGIVKKEIISKKLYLKELQKLLTQKYISSATYQTKQDEIINLESILHQIQMDMIKYKKSLKYTIVSPINGIATNIMSEIGEYINPDKPIVNILPDNSRLIAQLYVPTSKSGFISSRDKVSIQFDAYPYHRFGISEAKIQSISQTILTDKDDNKPIKVSGPYYKIIASLDKQTISLYGRSRYLQQGMTFSAVIYGSRKKVWQWIFDPLFNFYGEIWK
ncbi:MAG: HlyD family efflux transporter periplasmic adaptor subunit [Legionellaceae bacterium]|nr:HlyD family efflux transporter periplasmic adaptor subunit [Legionellaceae bacterium]